MALERGWQACAPGDPSDAQLETVWRLSGPRGFSMTKYNVTNGELQVIIDRPGLRPVSYRIARGGEIVAGPNLVN